MLDDAEQDGVGSALILPDLPGVQLNNTMRDAVKAKPDLEADLRKASAITGVPLDSARNDADYVKAEASFVAMDLNGLTVRSPGTAQFLADANNARIAHDDIDTLSGIERTFKYIGDIGKASALQVGASTMGLVQFGSEQSAAVSAARGEPVSPEMVARRAQEVQLRKDLQTKADAATPKGEDNLSKGLTSGLMSFAQNFPLMAASVLMRNPEIALAGAGAMTFGSEFGKAKDAGKDTGKAAGYAAGQGAVEVLTEMLPMGQLIGDIAKGTGFGKTLAKQFALDAPGEQIATLVQDFNEWQTLHPEKSLTDFIGERGNAAVQTLIASAVGTAAGVTTARLTDVAVQKFVGTAKVSNAQESTEAIKTLDKEATASKLRERDPQAFENYIVSITEDTPVEHLYLDPKALTEALAQSGHDVEASAAILQRMPVTAAQLEEAMQTGTDLKIPVGEFAAYMAGNELAQGLIPHLKTTPDGFSQEEAKAYVAEEGDMLSAEVEKVMTQAQVQEAHQASREVVKQHFVQQLTAANRHTADVNEINASLTADFYATQAERLGITPEEMLARYPLTVRAEGVGATALSQVEPMFAPVPDEAGMVTLSHWSDKGRMKTLDPEKWGENWDILPDAEKMRVGDAPGRVYWGVGQGKPGQYTPEPGIGDHRYETQVPLERLYDMDKDPGGLRQAAIDEVQAANPEDTLTDLEPEIVTAFERKIKEAGHLGYWSNNPELGVVAATFEPVKSTYKGRAKLSQGQGPLQGLPARIKVDGEVVTFGPFQVARDAAVAYMDEAGLPYNPPRTYAKVDEARAARIAEAYEAMEHDPSDPDVAEAYDAMIAETLAQWQTIKATGLQVEFNEQGIDPYGNPRNAIIDVVENNHLWVFPTEEGFGGALVNIGLNVNDGSTISAEEATAALKAIGVDVVSQAVHASNTEPTFVARLSRPLTPEEATGISAALKQDAIVQLNGAEGALHGPNAEAWGDYDPQYFLTLNGQPASEAQTSDNPLLAPVPGETFNGKPVMVNDIFRVVHDYFGHVKEGVGFRADGEENAWRSHAAMYSPLARKAMTTETRGQNSWVNFGPFAEANKTADGASTVYAEQKIGLLPDWVVTEGAGDTATVLNQSAVSAKAAAQGKKLADTIPGLKGVLPFLTEDERARLKKVSGENLLRKLKAMPSAEEMASAAYAGRAKRGWYESSAEAILNVFGAADGTRFAALLAALSPQTSVESNAYNALATWVNWDRAGRPTDRQGIIDVLGDSVQGGKGRGSILDAWINNSVRALSTTNPADIELSGPKVSSFAANLIGVVDEVTNDAWMANYADIGQELFAGAAQKPDAEGYKSGKSTGYVAMSVVVRKAAAILTKRTGTPWTPSEVQETVWSFAKTLYEKGDSAGNDQTMEQMLAAGGLTHEDIGGTPDFAVLFASGIYRKILAAGGYANAVDALGSDGPADGPTGNAASPEGAGIADATFERHLKAVAKRLERRRAESRGTERALAQEAPRLIPAVKGADGRIVTAPGGEHADAFTQLPEDQRPRGNTLSSTIGFVNHKGQFLTRERAMDYALENDLIKPSFQAFARRGDQLVSEWLEQDLEQGQRGSFDPQTSVMTLLRGADLSTFLHESGHFYLETLADIASQPDAPQEIVDDMNVLLAYMGHAEHTAASWKSLPLDERREGHEIVARSFEAYLLEGKAPSNEARGVFQRIRAWLLNIYQSAKALNVELTDDVRAVFDRMLASKQQIEMAERASGLLPMFETAEAAGMTAEEWISYQALGVQATADAEDNLQTRSIRDMRWLANAKDKAIRDLQAEARERRKAVRAEVTAEVMAEPVNRARELLKRGTIDGQPVEGPTKLSLVELREMYPGNAQYPGTGIDTKALGRGKYGMVAEEGIHPEQVAEMFGFSSGDELVKALISAEQPRAKIEGITDQRMLERYGDLTDYPSIVRAAEAAIHNDARLRFVATEMNALAKAAGSRKVLASAARDFAGQMVARLRVRDLKPTRYAAAETRAAANAQKLALAGKLAEAAVEKRNQLINGYATKAAYDAQAEVEKALRLFDRVQGSQGLDPDYRDQIDALLERFDLRKGTTLKEIDKRKSLTSWVEGQRDQGFEPIIPEGLLNEAYRKSFKDMTVEEMRGLADSVRNIAHLGRLKKKLLTAKDKRDFAVIVDAAVDTIERNAIGTVKKAIESNTWIDKTGSGVKEFFAMHRKFSSLIRQMDGFVDNGPLWGLFVRNLNAAGDREAVMREQATKALHVIFSPIVKAGRLRDKVFIPEIGASLSLEGRLAVALNQGNETNRLRVMDGDGWTQEQVDAILRTLTPEHFTFVQNVWDHIDSYWPQIAAKERRVSGVEPEKVLANPIDVVASDGTVVSLRGGYYPIKYDANRSTRAETDELADLIKQGMQGAHTRATTRRGHTKARVEKVERPTRKDFGVIFEHIAQVAHDLSFHEYLIDANRLLRSGGVDSAIRTHYGPEVLRSMRKLLEDVAVGDTPALNVFERGINHLRTGATIAGLGWNLTTSLLQPLGLMQSTVRIGPKWVGVGLGRAFRDAASMQSSVQWINDKSDFMRLRAKTQQREINEIRNQVSSGKPAVLNAVEQSFFYMIAKMQLVADVPTWIGQYEKTMSTGVDEDTAIAMADQAVRDSQGSGLTGDLSQVQRGGPLMKLWTNFYSFFNTTYNLLAEKTNETRLAGPSRLPVLAADVFLLMFVPSLMATIVKSAMKGDWEDLPEKLAKDELGYWLGLMIGMREAGSMISSPGGYSGLSGLRFFQEVGKLVKQTQQGEADEAFFKAANNAAGILFHYPAGQVQRTVLGIQALANGESKNPLAPVVGPPPK